MTLYEITKDLDALHEIMNSEDGFTAEDQQILINFLDEADKNIESKLEGYVKVIRNFESDVDAIKKEIDYLSNKKKVLENKASNLENNIKYFLKRFNLKEKKAGIFYIKIRKNPASLKITGDVAKSYMIPQPDKIDNSKIKDDLKNGIVLDFAVLEYGESLQIK